MWRLNGLADNQIKLLDVCRPTVLFCSVEGSQTAYEVTGKHLHALYVVDTGKIRPATVGLGGDERDSSMKVEFDLKGPIHLNLPGTIYLTDGDPNQEYEVSTSIFEYNCYMPTWHPLTAVVPSGSYSVPKYHSVIYTTDFILQFQQAGVPAWLDHTPIPIVGGSEVQILTEPSIITTAWWG